MIRLLVLVSLVAAAGEIIFLSLQGFSPRQGYAPKQPVAFSHKLHSGVMDVPCQYCHTQVSKGRHATVPSGNICMNCHEHVDAPQVLMRPPLKSLSKDCIQGGKVDQWVNVFDLPDHVYFNHQPHVHAGVACETCHRRNQEDGRGEDSCDAKHGLVFGLIIVLNRDISTCPFTEKTSKYFGMCSK